VVNGEVNRLTHLVDNLNFFAQPLDLHCVPASLEQIFDEALVLIPKEERKKWEFQKTFSLTKVHCVCDPENMKKVFVHCFRNAIQATPNGGVIWVRAYPEVSKEKVDFISIQIHDNGNGMTQEECEQAFEPFFTTKNQGIGLGLTIVKKIVEAHHGSVELESSVGKGTTVFIQIPAKSKQSALHTNEPETTHLNR
jgi:signal transduction histidine kinase